MTDKLPEIAPGINTDTGAATAIVGNARFADMAALLTQVPELSEPGYAAACARAYNHFARAMTYTLIEDPAAFESAYRERYEAEDPETPWTQGVHRLRDYGMPDFATIAPPAVADGAIRFFVEDDLTGLPYLAEGPLTDPAEARYQPLPLTPSAPPPPDTAATQAE